MTGDEQRVAAIRERAGYVAGILEEYEFEDAASEAPALLNELADANAALLDRLRTAETVRDDLITGYDKRDRRIIELEAAKIRAEARAVEAEAEATKWRMVAEQLAGADSKALIAYNRAEAWDECRQAAYDLSGSDLVDAALMEANPYRAGADQ